MAPLDYCRRKIEMMSEQDLQLQSRLIAATLAQTAKPTKRDRMNGSDKEASRTDGEARQLIKAAIRDITREIESSAVIVAEDIGWLDVNDDKSGYQGIIDAVDQSLYSGIAGISIFLAYAGKLGISEDERGCVDLCLKKLLGPLAAPRTISDWSAFGGAMGTIYALVHLACLSGDRMIVDELTRIELPSESQLLRNEHHDIIAGHAGTILAMLRAFEATGREEYIVLATRLGHRLVELRESDEDSCWWVSPEFGVALTGFAHGAGGIAFALNELGAQTGEMVFSDVARKALNFEQRTYDFAHSDWPDRRPEPGSGEAGSNIAADAWCHGRPGIWLARGLAGGPGVPENETCHPQRLVDTKVGSDCLCHGALGNLDIAITLERSADAASFDSAVLHRAAEIASGIIDGTSRSGLRSGIATPGLMLGLSGMGLSLLRCLYPEQVPSCLTLEGPPAGFKPASRVSTLATRTSI